MTRCFYHFPPEFCIPFDELKIFIPFHFDLSISIPDCSESTSRSKSNWSLTTSIAYISKSYPVFAFSCLHNVKYITPPSPTTAICIPM